MQIEGMRYICDRCGIEVFAERKSDVVLDGGFTRARQYDDEPICGWTRSDGKDLCPDCSKKLEIVINNFYNNVGDDKIEFQKS